MYNKPFSEETTTWKDEEIWIERTKSYWWWYCYCCVVFITNAFSEEKNHMLDVIFPWWMVRYITHWRLCMLFTLIWVEWLLYEFMALFFSVIIIVQYCFFSIPSYYFFFFLFVVVGFCCCSDSLSMFGFACENYQLAHFGRIFNIHIFVSFGTSHTSAVWLRYCSDISVLFFIMLNIRRWKRREIKSKKKKKNLSRGLHTVRFLSFVYLKNPVNFFFYTLTFCTLIPE